MLPARSEDKTMASERLAARLAISASSFMGDPGGDGLDAEHDKCAAIGAIVRILPCFTEESLWRLAENLVNELESKKAPPLRLAAPASRHPNKTGRLLLNGVT